jgi:MFS family permease
LLRYFVIQTMAGLGIQTFLPTAAVDGFDVPLLLANVALTAYLSGEAGGILAGGFLAAKTERHDRVAMTRPSVGCADARSAPPATPMPLPLVLPLFADDRFRARRHRPSRDLIVKAATPKGAAGRVYGFVYSGLDLGGTIGPIVFGFMLDHALAHELFYAIAACLLLAIGTVVQLKRASTSHGAPARQNG